MTTTALQAIERMNKSGMNDSQIAEEIGERVWIVNFHRKALGLKRVGINRTKVKYSVYDAKTGKLVCEGTGRECAQALGLQYCTFRTYCTRSKNGGPCKYEIHKVVEDEEN